MPKTWKQRGRSYGPIDPPSPLRMNDHDKDQERWPRGWLNERSSPILVRNGSEGRGAKQRPYPPFGFSDGLAAVSTGGHGWYDSNRDVQDQIIPGRPGQVEKIPTCCYYITFINDLQCPGLNKHPCCEDNSIATGAHEG